MQEISNAMEEKEGGEPGVGEEEEDEGGNFKFLFFFCKCKYGKYN